VTITADNQRVISLDYEGIITIWNMNTGVQLLNLPAPEGYHGGRLFIGSHGRTLAYHGVNTTVWSTGKIAEPSQEEESR
jgi:hypothetical protein